MSNNDFINSPRAFLGRGWSFPPNFIKGEGIVEMTEAEANIKDSLYILLTTTLGERIMHPDYGSTLSKLQFEPIDTTFSTYITEQVKNAILYFEPRINLEGVDYLSDGIDGKVNLKVNFSIVGTNIRSNIVYPFYINEGTDVRQ